MGIMPIFRTGRLRQSAVVAAVLLPCVAILGLSVWHRVEQTETRYRALSEARLVATKVDLYFDSIGNLLTGLSMAVSTRPSDVDANDVTLRRVKSELPESIANILVFSLDGQNIGNAVGQHASAGDREYFKKVMAGAAFVVGTPIFSRSNIGRVVPVARPIRDSSGQTQAVLVVAIFSD